MGCSRYVYIMYTIHIDAIVNAFVKNRVINASNRKSIFIPSDKHIEKRVRITQKHKIKIKMNIKCT